MLAFLTGVIIGVPVSLISLKLVNNLSDINDQLTKLDYKVERLIDKAPTTDRLPFEARN
tara:strand:+ start:185 stop:361 length:177 start_codon:yes stop_codon:yes gene_type:complete